MTQPINAGAPDPVQGVYGGPGLTQGVAGIDGTTGNVVIQPPNNTIQQRKTDSPQSFQLYEFFHTNIDYARVSLNANSGGPFTILTEGPGVQRDLVIQTARGLTLNAGGANPIQFWTSNTHRWDISTQGGWIPFLDNAYDFGTLTQRTRNLFVADHINIAGISILAGTGVPATGLGTIGDFYFRSDTPATALQRIYIKTAAAVWTGIV